MENLKGQKLRDFQTYNTFWSKNGLFFGVLDFRAKTFKIRV